MPDETPAAGAPDGAPDTIDPGDALDRLQAALTDGNGDLASTVSRFFSDLVEWAPYGAIAVAFGALVYVIAWIGLRAVARVISLGAKHKEDHWRAELAKSLRRTSVWFLLAIAALVASIAFPGPPALDTAIRLAATFAIVIQIAIWVQRLVLGILRQFAERRTQNDPSFGNAATLFRWIAQVAVWSVAGLLILDNLGIDITALVAGLGIGGIAIGLAAQGIFSDLFACLSILLDRPFAQGDFIVFGTNSGTVEKIGLKTTRIRALSGQQIIISNANLLNAEINNYQRLYERRIVFQVGVTYQTPIAKMRRIPDIIRKAVEETPRTRFDRCHFISFGDFALLVETVYFVQSADYAIYRDTQQTINFAIMAAFEEEGIEFAYPTQTLYVTSEYVGPAGAAIPEPTGA